MAAQGIRRVAPGTRVVVVGTGYVGLPAAILLAHRGCTVIGVDTNPEVVDAINRGVVHIDEPELQELLTDPGCRARLSATGEMVPGDVFIIAVPTPVDHRKRIVDMRAVASALTS